MLKLVSACLIGAFALVACSNPEADLEGDLEIGGADPVYWTVQVEREAGKSIISIIGDPQFEGEAPVRSRGENGAFLLTSKTPKGDFVMNFTQKECFDGLADTPRPWTVNATWNGEILNGCALSR